MTASVELSTRSEEECRRSASSCPTQRTSEGQLLLPFLSFLRSIVGGEMLHLVEAMLDGVELGHVAEMPLAGEVRRARLLGLDRPAGEVDTPDSAALIALLARGDGRGAPKEYDA